MDNHFCLKKLFFVQALTDVHCGTGQGVDDIDMPTAKEASTNFPLIPGSSIKGVMRDYFQRILPKDKLFSVFGPDLQDDNSEAHASAMMITDGRILLLPVRSFVGVFSYVTCPLTLSRFLRDMHYAGISSLSIPVPSLQANEAMVSSNSTNSVEGHLVLEDLDLIIRSDAPEWESWCNFLSTMLFDADWGADVAMPRITLVSDTVFRFLCTTALPVTARIRLNKTTGTVDKGALWYEESVPSEAIFSGVIAATKTFGKKEMLAVDVLSDLTGSPLTLQLGGKATTGKGLCHIRFMGQEAT
jgi:CRISPR-associated protein Cmr4